VINLEIDLKNILLRSEESQDLLKDFDLQFSKTGIFHLQGEIETSSEFMKCLVGIREFSRGEYRINGSLVTEMSFEEFLPYRLSMGYVFDFGGLLSNKTLQENLLLGIEYHSFFDNEKAAAKIREFIYRMNIVEYMHLRPFHVPGYVRKLVCVLRAFLHEPKLLLLDQPASALDPKRKVALWSWIEEQIQNKDILTLISSHEKIPFLTKEVNLESKKAA
jgi:phospholipid/cholesterol/gamma-HCH transport system ATP-binding protein